MLRNPVGAEGAQIGSAARSLSAPQNGPHPHARLEVYMPAPQEDGGGGAPSGNDLELGCSI